MQGTLRQALGAEKMDILAYRLLHNRLPPGNKMMK